MVEMSATERPLRLYKNTTRHVASATPRLR